MASEFDSFDSSSEFDVYCATSHFARGCGILDLIIGGEMQLADGVENVVERICRLADPQEFVAVNDTNSGEGPQPDGSITDMIVYKDHLYVCGSFDTIMRLNNETGEFDVVGTMTYSPSATLGIAEQFCIFNDLLVVCGSWENMDGATDSWKIAAYNGTSWQGLHSPPAYPQRYFATGKNAGCCVFNGELYTHISNGLFFDAPTATSGTRNNLIKYTGSGWTVVQAEDWFVARKLRVFEGHIYGENVFYWKWPGNTQVGPSKSPGERMGIAGNKLVFVGTFDDFEGTDGNGGCIQYSAATGYEAIGDPLDNLIEGNDAIEFNGDLYICGNILQGPFPYDIKHVLKLDRENNVWVTGGKNNGPNATADVMLEVPNLTYTYPEP